MDKKLGLLDALYELPRRPLAALHGPFLPECAASDAAGKIREVRLMLKAIHAAEDRELAHRKAEEVASKLRGLRLNRTARIVVEGCDETLTRYDFRSAHWRNLRPNNPLEWLNREIYHRTRVVGSFPDGHAALMLVSARLRYMAGQMPPRDT